MVLVALPFEAIGAASDELLAKCELSDPCLANSGEYHSADQRNVKFNGLDDCTRGSAETVRSCWASVEEHAGAHGDLLASVRATARAPVRRSSAGGEPLVWRLSASMCCSKWEVMQIPHCPWVWM